MILLSLYIPLPCSLLCWQILLSLRATQQVQTNIAAKHLKTCGPSRAPCWNLNWKVDAILTTDGSQRGFPFIPIPLRICEGSVTAHNVVQANLLVAAAFLVWYSLDPNLRRASGWDEKGRRALETARTAKATQQRTFFPATICSIPHPYYMHIFHHVPRTWQSHDTASDAPSTQASWPNDMSSKGILTQFPLVAARIRWNRTRLSFYPIPQSCSICMLNWEGSWNFTYI